MSSPNRAFHSTCPVCGHSNLALKYKIKGFTLVQCPGCELIFVRDRLSAQELDTFYSQTNEGGGDNPDFVYLNRENDENLKFYFRNLKSLIRDRVPAGAVLDIGCNTGGFLDVMDGYDRFGIERSPNHARLAKEKYGENIFEGAFEDYQPPGGLRFDCITLQDVLDHMADPLAVLKKCHQLLKSKGLIVIKVHDMGCLYAKLTGKNFYALIPPVHLFYFNRRSLTAALNRASFELVAARHMGHVLFISTIFYRLAKGNKAGLYFRIHQWLEGTWLGRRKIHKNLHDIITVFGVKKEESLRS